MSSKETSTSLYRADEGICHGGHSYCAKVDKEAKIEENNHLDSMRAGFYQCQKQLFASQCTMLMIQAKMPKPALGRVSCIPNAKYLLLIEQNDATQIVATNPLL